MDLVDAIGSTRGRFQHKHNRAAKLLATWDQLKAKMEGMVERGHGETENSRLAYAVLVMMETGIRVGNEDSAEGLVCENKHSPNFGKTVQTFGLTTLLSDHVTIGKNHLELNFTGKKAVEQELVVTHPLLVKYAPDGPLGALWLGIEYYYLKKFVKRYVGKGYTPKDIRIAKVNGYFVTKFAKEFADPYLADKTKSGRKRVLRTCIEETAAHIGHTPGVCRSSYLSAPLLAAITDEQVAFHFPEVWSYSPPDKPPKRPARERRIRSL